jgi:cytochrome c2
MKVRRWLFRGAWVAAALIVAVPLAYGRLFPLPTRYADDVEHFKYASVGVEAAQGVPFEVWRTLPGVCMDPAQRQAGYRTFGFQWEPGHSTPVGMPLETAIVPRVGINCALCHVGRVEGPDGTSRLLVGAPNTSLDLQAYLRFLFDCAASPKFTADAILAENARLGGDLNIAERLFYRAVIIPQVKSALLGQKHQLAFMDGQPDWGPGRTAGFQPAKVQVLGRPFDGTLDIADIPPLWELRLREGGAYHWDGANTSRHEVFLNSGIGNGASAATIDVPSLERTEHWALDNRPPRYPWPVDAALAARGQGLFAAECAQCHEPGMGKTGQVVPISWLGTDRNRLDAFTVETAQAFREASGYPWRYAHFRKTNGYVATPLNGIWARAPYLHNGSVPTLDALLAPPGQRPRTFYRGSARYDPIQVGFASDRGWRFDTGLAGNGNAGHLWGTTLPEPDRRALLEYLKTL